jgi:hypothetical protein
MLARTAAKAARLERPEFAGLKARASTVLQAFRYL